MLTCDKLSFHTFKMLKLSAELLLPLFPLDVPGEMAAVQMCSPADVQVAEYLFQNSKFIVLYCVGF